MVEKISPDQPNMAEGYLFLTLTRSIHISTEMWIYVDLLGGLDWSRCSLFRRNSNNCLIPRMLICVVVNNSLKVRKLVTLPLREECGKN